MKATPQALDEEHALNTQTEHITSEAILMSKYIAESIKQLVAGHFGHVGLRQLRTKHTNIQTLSVCNVM